MSQSLATTDRSGRSKWQNVYHEKYSLRNRIIVFLDGTWNDGKSKTNVWRLYEQCEVHENFRGVRQVKHYIKGVSGILGGFNGSGHTDMLVEAYIFICQNWRSRYDEVVLVGFSRGGFSAQLLALFLDHLGVAKWDPAPEFGHAEVKQYKKTFYHDIRGVVDEWEKKEGDGPKKYGRGVIITACAVWDAVAALEGPRLKWIAKPERKDFLFAYHCLPPIVRNAFHALALNENRRAFEPVLWHLPESGENPEPGDLPEPGDSTQKLKQCWFP